MCIRASYSGFHQLLAFRVGYSKRVSSLLGFIWGKRKELHVRENTGQEAGRCNECAAVERKMVFPETGATAKGNWGKNRLRVGESPSGSRFFLCLASHPDTC